MKYCVDKSGFVVVDVGDDCDVVEVRVEGVCYIRVFKECGVVLGS